MIFQEPMTSLNPVYTVGYQIAETVRVHEGLDTRDSLGQGAGDAARSGNSGPGASNPRIPLPAFRRHAPEGHDCDGLGLQSEGLNCRRADDGAGCDRSSSDFGLDEIIQEKTGAAILFITHNMAAIAEMANRVVVMYAGRKVEEGPVEKILGEPRHPYTKGLISSVPHLMIPPLRSGPL